MSFVRKTGHEYVSTFFLNIHPLGNLGEEQLLRKEWTGLDQWILKRQASCTLGNSYSLGFRQISQDYTLSTTDISSLLSEGATDSKTIPAAHLQWNGTSLTARKASSVAGVSSAAWGVLRILGTSGSLLSTTEENFLMNETEAKLTN